jgi:hypothetical protein
MEDHTEGSVDDRKDQVENSNDTILGGDMKMIDVMRFESMGISAGLYHLFDDDGTEFGWSVVSTSTGKVLQCISFEHARHVWDGCVNEIRDKVGWSA